MAKGIAPDDETKEMVKALLATGKAKNQVAKEVGLSWATVDKISKEDPDDLERLREHKRTEFVKKLWVNIEDAIELGHTMILEAKENKREIPLSHISTYVGTLYDKQALMTGGKTADVGVTIVDDLK
jgi:transposase